MNHVFRHPIPRSRVFSASHPPNPRQFRPRAVVGRPLRAFSAPVLITGLMGYAIAGVHCDTLCAVLPNPMAHIFHEGGSNEDDPQRRWQRYFAYLESISDRLPTSACGFAKAGWHYDTTDHRALHDSWVEWLKISEPSSGDRHKIRSLEIEVRLLGAYHDGHMTLKYHGVQSYSLATPLEFKYPPLDSGHGDWLQDEVRLSERGFVLHEIEFSRGSRWTIECEDIEWEWEPL